MDIGVISAGLLPFVKSFQVDKDQHFTPRRLRKTKKGVVSSYSDHFSLEVIFGGLPRSGTSHKKKESGCSWNLKKENGYEKYKEETKKIANNIDDIIRDETINIEECMQRIEAENNKAKWAAFGKTRNTAGKKLTAKEKKPVENDDDILKEQNRKIEDEINEIKRASHGQLTRVFNMRKKISGGKKQGQEPSAIRDPETDELIVESSKIKATTRTYCISNLKDNKLDKNASKLFKLKENLHNMRMSEDTKDEFVVHEDEYKEVIKVFAKKDTKSYDFLLKAAQEYIEAIGRVCIKMINNEQFPEQFRETTLQMIWKSKGPAEILKNNRFLHLKSYLPRACEALIVGRMKQDILAASSPYQVGGQPGHSAD